jgi:hypothetical protein
VKLVFLYHSETVNILIEMQDIKAHAPKYDAENPSLIFDKTLTVEDMRRLGSQDDSEL